MYSLNNMTYKQFATAMKEIKNLETIQHKIDKALKLLSPDFGSFGLDLVITNMINLLEIAMEDKGEDIEYYIYETRWGKTGKDCITEENGKKKSLTNYKELYNYIKL